MLLVYTSGMTRVQILGVPIDAVSFHQAVSTLFDMARGSSQHHVMTPNNEMLVEAHRNKKFHALLQRTSLNLPDSSGLLFAARQTGQSLPERVPGVDAMMALCKQLDEHTPVFLLGAGEGVAARAAEELRRSNPQLRIAGTYAGSPSDEDAAEITKRIIASKAAVLFVAYGAPKQDVWIDVHLSSLPSVRLAMGVGGSFDFLAGTATRAPVVFRRVYLEWLWRLLLQPWRLPRILRATVVFPLLVLRHGKGGDSRKS